MHIIQFLRKVDLWHGFAVKKIGLFDSNYSFSIKLNEAILMVKNSIKPGNWQERYLLSTSVWQKVYICYLLVVLKIRLLLGHTLVIIIC